MAATALKEGHQVDLFIAGDGNEQTQRALQGASEATRVANAILTKSS